MQIVTPKSYFWHEPEFLGARTDDVIRIVSVAGTFEPSLDPILCKITPLKVRKSCF